MIERPRSCSDRETIAATIVNSEIEVRQTARSRDGPQPCLVLDEAQADRSSSERGADEGPNLGIAHLPDVPIVQEVYEAQAKAKAQHDGYDVADEGVVGRLLRYRVSPDPPHPGRCRPDEADPAEQQHPEHEAPGSQLRPRPVERGLYVTRKADRYDPVVHEEDTVEDDPQLR